MSNQEILKLLQTCEDNVKDGGVFESNERAVIANHAHGLVTHPDEERLHLFRLLEIQG